MAIMLAGRGVAQVRGTALSAAANASISGIAGVGHILAGAGIILLLLSFKKMTKNLRRTYEHAFCFPRQKAHRAA